MGNEHSEGIVSRRCFLKQSAVATVALGAARSISPDRRPMVDAAGTLSPLQPPDDEVLVTIRQVDTTSIFDDSALALLTSVLSRILQPIGWRLRALPQANGANMIVFKGRIIGGPTTMYTVIRYQNINAQVPSHAALLATAAILTGSSQLQAYLRNLPGDARLSAAPNWVIAAAPGGFVQGGPGGLPSAAPGDKGWHFTFPTLSSSGDFLKAPHGATVVVLDTSPSLNSLETALPSYPSNILLRDVVAQFRKPGHWHSAVASPPVLSPIPPVPRARQRPCGLSMYYPPYQMIDHGLFVAGIVRDIAPHCDLRIVRVLNQWGAAYLSDLLAGLARVPLKNTTVVNMSLTVRMPEFAELREQLGSSPAPISELAQLWLGMADACAPLAEVLQLFADGGTLLVGATGNDSGNGPLRDPCAPAAFDSTLGVAAVNQLNQRACYSNRGDDEAAENDSVVNGIATLGGDQGNPVYGLYSAPEIYLPPKMAMPANSNGWAHWVGTSFASPVISALAANYLANNPAASPSAVMMQIKALGIPSDPTLQALTIPARQVHA